MQRPFKTTVRYVQEHKTVRIQYAVCADNVAAAKRALSRRLTEQQANGYEIENVVAATGQEAARLNLADDGVVVLA
jgi:2-methylcitrate dehydratase PrpD